MSTKKILYKTCGRKLTHYYRFVSIAGSTNVYISLFWLCILGKAGFRIRIRIGSVFNRASGSGSVFGIRIRIQEGKNNPHKEKKFMFWSVGWPLLWAAGFFCNLDILYGGLGIGKLQFLIKKNIIFFSPVIFFKFLVIKALDPDWIRIRIRIRIGLQPQPLDPDPDP